MSALFLHFLTDMPTWVLLLTKATLILALAWCVHFAIANLNPRWRVFLRRITGISLITLAVLAMFAPRLMVRMEVAPRDVAGNSAAYAAATVPSHQDHCAK